MKLQQINWTSYCNVLRQGIGRQTSALLQELYWLLSAVTTPHHQSKTLADGPGCALSSLSHTHRPQSPSHSSSPLPFSSNRIPVLAPDTSNASPTLRNQRTFEQALQREHYCRVATILDLLHIVKKINTFV